MLVNVKDVCHCFINVQTLPNKEAQVSPEPPVRAGGVCVGAFVLKEVRDPVPSREEMAVGPREHFTALCPGAGHGSPEGGHLCIAAHCPGP